MPTKTVFTPEEEAQIFRAACRTWEYVASDAAQLGVRGVEGALELVLDAGRITNIGKLDSKVADKLYALDWKGMCSLLKKNKGRWF